MLRGLSFICPRFHNTCERHEQLKFGCFMTHATSIISTKIWLSSPTPWYHLHRTIIRWLHDDIARASRSRVAFVRQSDSFLFPSYCLRESKNAQYHRWSYEVITMMSRFDKIPLRWPYEGQNEHTKSIRKWAFVRTSVNFFACQRFCLRSQSCCRSLENTTGGHTMGKDGFANGPMFPRSDPNLNIFIFVYSAFKFGTVWRLHNGNP